ncbi:MAG: PfaD family polyunsaturated fatty acid/polyketide biosynthesis protein [Planctomycetes bacterium]|nr:PfaD family polyunsaturated fatty acid/polyketide biosynthesis protein [Planctomycetota bacterium]
MTLSQAAGSQRSARDFTLLFRDAPALNGALLDVHRPLLIVRKDGQYELGTADGMWNGESRDREGSPIAAVVPPCSLKNLGDVSFCSDHRLEYPCFAGAMANGIASVEMVEAMGRAGMLASFGAAGLSVRQVEAAIDRVLGSRGDMPFCFNLIHSPNEPGLEAAVVDLYLRRGIRLVEASAYLDLTRPVVRYRVHGIHRDSCGRVVTPNRIIAKVSRVEVASKFFAPPPHKFLQDLVAAGDISEEQAGLASEIPMAQDLTAEADSAGHTDNRPAITLIPTLLALRDQAQSKAGYAEPLRVGAAGGISTPAAAAAAFTMGAAYVVTGSVNQACVESGSSDIVREMLAQAQQADTMMAPAADMFEMGVKVQVLKRGTMFAMRAAKLYELYRSCAGLEEIPPEERAWLEKNLFRASLDEIWKQTREFFLVRDRSHLDRAEKDPKHKMALVFRWYLGHASRWANAGEPSRKIDYQVWCGPAMGAFNEWARGSFLEAARNRRVVTVALNILYGAAVLLRLNALRLQGIPVPPDWLRTAPLELEPLQNRLNGHKER